MKLERRLACLAFASLSVLCSCRLERHAAQSPFSKDAGTTRPPPGDSAGSEAAAGSGQHSGAGPSTSTGGTGGSGGSGGTAGAPSVMGAGAGGMTADPLQPDAAIASDAGATCAPDVALCNPVTNDGCPSGMQCAVDLAAQVLAGYCIFSAPMAMPDGTCFNSGVTESCPPTSTCFAFQCRTLCFCDADCEEGQCCVEPVGSLGFKVCGEC